MYRFQIRNEVRYLLRDETYPATAINAAINRVLTNINNMGRFRFHQDFSDITLVTATASYAVTKTILAEEFVVINPDTTTQKILSKYSSFLDAKVAGAFVTTGDAPKFYARWENLWYFDNVPNATANGKTVRIYHFTDIPKLYGDLEAVTRLPDRYQHTTLAYGVVAELSPAVQLQDGKGGYIAARSAFKESVRDMIMQEKWEPLVSHSLLLGRRWVDWELAGHVGRVR